MTRDLRNSHTFTPIRARFLALTGAFALASAGLLSAAPAFATPSDVSDFSLSAECEDAGFRVTGEGVFATDASVVKSFVRVDDELGKVEFFTAEPGEDLQVSARSILVTDPATHRVEWSVNGEIVASDEFSADEVCGGQTPSPTPSESPDGATPSPSTSPEPSETRTPTPPESPDPTESAGPTSTPTPSDDPAPVEQSPSSEAPGSAQTHEPATVPAETESRAEQEAIAAAAKPMVALSSSSVATATSVTVNASGFAPGETLELWLHSTPWKLTDAIADADGNLSLAVGIAGGTDLGEHQIEVRGATTGSVFVDVLVTDDLAITGIDSAFASGAVTTALALVLGGVTVVLLARRAQRAVED